MEAPAKEQTSKLTMHIHPRQELKFYWMDCGQYVSTAHYFWRGGSSTQKTLGSLLLVSSSLRWLVDIHRFTSLQGSYQINQFFSAVWLLEN